MMNAQPRMTRPSTLQRAASLLAISASLLLAACGGGMVAGAEDPLPDVPTGPGGVITNPFPASPDDLPAVNANTYPYSTPSMLDIGVHYVPTTASGPGYYLDSDGVCTQQSTPPADTYPGGLITLDTVNLDVNKTDPCEPEIMVKTQIGTGPTAIEADAKMRLRGSSTRLATLKSYRLKLSGGASWMDESTFQLNKHPYDLTRVRNKLAFDLMETIPNLPSLGTQFVHMAYDSGNGVMQNMGLYTHVEKMGSKDYLQRRGWVAGSNVYKAETFSFNTPKGTDFAVNPDGSAGPNFENLLSIESDSGNHRAIIQLVQDLNDGNKDFNSIFAAHFNRNNYLTWLASVILLGNNDTQDRNFGLYQPLGTAKFYFTPWDYDGALGYTDQPSVEKYPDWESGIGNWWISVLHRRFMQQPGNLALLKAAVDTLHTQYLTQASIKARLDSYRPLIESTLATSPDLENLAISHSDPSSPMQQWDKEYNRLVQVVDTNYQNFLTSLQHPMPFWLSASAGANGALAVDWSWPAPFHPQGKPITYGVTIARVTGTEAPFAPDTIVAQESGLTATQWNTGPLPAGQYLIRVLASDPDGNSTYGFNNATVNGTEVFGADCVNMPDAATCP